MNTELIILGAGKPHSGKKPSGLKTTIGETKVLDWILNSVKKLNPKVNFVGGYQMKEIIANYPKFKYILNTKWQSTKASYSLLQCTFKKNTNYLVIYSDILFRNDFINQLIEVKSDVVIAIDTYWNHRFIGRAKEDLLGCEKVSFENSNITKLGYDIKLENTNAEFIGCVYFKPRAISLIVDKKEKIQKMLSNGNLSELIEFLRNQGLTVKGLDVCGDWAELNAPQDLAHFILGTKAQTLDRLQSMVKISKIEDQISFTVDDWLNDKGSILKIIKDKFKQKNIIVRSSALSEDSFINSNAGAFKSVLNIKIENDLEIKNSIQQVIESYQDKNTNNQILVQPMLIDVKLSGVIFTKTLSHGAPYYVINYDIISGRTDSITSGDSSESNTILIRRDEKFNSNVPNNLKPLILAVEEIENMLSYDSLDIEFAITKKNVHILQVRPLAIKHDFYQTYQFIDLLKSEESNFKNKQKKSANMFGNKNIFGVMPDWNPAEIIGVKPKTLTLSLYNYLILDDVWAIQRAQYGYKDIRPAPLLCLFAGHPYVDVRASLSSFIPKNLSNEQSHKFVNFCLNFLEKNPQFHDKIEFEIIPTCLDLDFEKWETRFKKNGFTKNEIDNLRKGLKSITKNAIERKGEDLLLIEILETKFRQICESKKEELYKVKILLNDCKKYGTLPFAHLARNAFVAISLLKSAVSKNIITQEDLDDFLSCIKTVSHQLTDDAFLTFKNKMSWHDFVNKYGHLRPGTYDITSQNYKQNPNFYLKPIIKNAKPAIHKSGYLWKKARKKLRNSLQQIGINISVDTLESFLIESIEGREYAKFKFSKNLSMALDLLTQWGKNNNISKDKLAHVSIKDLLLINPGSGPNHKSAKWIENKAKHGKSFYNKIAGIELPPLISNKEDFAVFEYPKTLANFIGSFKISAESIAIDINENLDLKGKIVLILKADPGYDWLFGRGIGGLITMYGGANSHMAIRAAEFGLPAVIGTGEILYKKLLNANFIEIDCRNRTIKVVS